LLADVRRGLPGLRPPGYDQRERRWRPRDTGPDRTGRGPPGQCGDHGGTQRARPWAEPGSRFTALFEAWGDAWLKEASIAEGYEPLGEAGCGRIESVTMAMGPAFTTAPHQHRPAAATKRAFEKFHVAQPPGASGGQVPRSEHKAWRAAGDDSLKGSRSFWLRHPEPMSDRAWPVFPGVACEPIEAGPGPGDPGGGDELGGVSFASGGSEGGGRGWPWAIRSRLEPIKRSAGG
jgi:hypothetical protein